MLPPPIFAPAPIVICGRVEFPTPRRMMVPPVLPLTRSNVPSPLPATAGSPSSKFSTGPEPVPCTAAPLARVRFSRETKMISDPVKGLPALSTVRFLVATATVFPAALEVRRPPISRLSALKLFSCGALSTRVPGVPPLPVALIRILPGLLISTRLPRPPAGGTALTRPSIIRLVVALKER